MRTSIRLLLLSLCVSLSHQGLVTNASLVAAEPTLRPPNIILVMTDDQGYPPLGRHGHPWIRTPNLDAMYDASTRFTRFLVSPTCSPTRSALMTGRHSLRNGVTHTILERERLRLDAVTLPQVLKQSGYATGIFGKWHLGDEEPYQPHNRGFDEAFIHGAGGIGQAYDCSCADVPGNSYDNPVIRHNGTFVQTRGYCTDVFFSAAMDWIRKQTASGHPFFACITPNAPHAPYVVPMEWKRRFLDRGFGNDQASFYGMIENIDQNFGRLMHLLHDQQLLQETVVIFMSDNGMTPGGSGKPGEPLGTDIDQRPMNFYNAGMKGLKNSPDEGGLRVPFLVRWDGHWAAGREIDRIAADLDVFPTLATIAGARQPEGQVEGRSLVPLLDNPQSDWPDRYLFTHIGRWPTGSEPNDYQWKTFSIRNQRFRLVNNTQLFDMEADPGQQKNVIDQHPETVEHMRAAWREWWAESRPMMVNETAALSKVRPFHELYQAQQKAGGIPEWAPLFSGENP